MPNYNFNLYNNKGETATVVLTATINGRRARFSPGITVNPRYWDKKGQRVLPIANLDPKHPQGVNDLLRSWEQVAESIYRANPEITAGDFVAALKLEKSGAGKQGVPEREQKTLDAFALSYAREKQEEGNGRYAATALVTSAKCLSRFVEHRGAPIYWSEIDKALLRRFKKFLERPEFNLSQNQIGNVLKRTKHFVKVAGPGEGNYNYHGRQLMGLKEWRVKQEQPYKQYLTEAELEQFLSYDLSDKPYLERQRDMFVLNAYTGLRRSDAKRLSRDNYHRSAKGGEQLKVYTRKTGQYVYIPLHPVAKRILDNYGWELPIISDQKYNTFIKEAAELAGLTHAVEYTHTRAGKRVTEMYRKCDKLSSHDARRSFATNFYERGFPAALLKQITGHTKEGQFLEYICTTPERAADLMAEKMAEQWAKTEAVAGV